jgi:chitinase
MKKLVAAYCMDHSVESLRASDVMKLDIIYYAFSSVQGGKPGLYGLRNAEFLANLRRLNTKLKIIVSIGGWGAGGFSEAAMTAEGRALFASSAMEYVRQYDYDGLDIDWEYPCSSAAGIASSPNDKENFTLLLAALRETLDAYGQEANRHMYLAAAVPSGTHSMRNMEIDKIGKLLDYLNLMTYDIRGGDWTPNAGHHTNLYPQTGDEDGMCADKAVAQYTEAGIPTEKIILGSAFYGRVWLDTPGFNQPGKGAATKRFTEIAAHCLPAEERPTGYTRYWDAQACAPYLYNGKDFISYDDEESLIHKCKFIVQKGLAGIMFWEYGGDRTGRLMNALTNPDSWKLTDGA